LKTKQKATKISYIFCHWDKNLWEAYSQLFYHLS